MKKLLSFEEMGESGCSFLIPVHSVNFASVDYVLKPMFTYWQLVVIYWKHRLQRLDRCL